MCPCSPKGRFSSSTFSNEPKPETTQMIIKSRMGKLWRRHPVKYDTAVRINNIITHSSTKEPHKDDIEQEKPDIKRHKLSDSRPN